MKEKEFISQALETDMPDIETVRQRCLNQDIKVNSKKRFTNIYLKRLMPVAACAVITAVTVLAVSQRNNFFTGNLSGDNTVPKASESASTVSPGSGVISHPGVISSSASSKVSDSSKTKQQNSKPTASRETTSSATRETTCVLPHWNERSINSKYGQIYFNSTEYNSAGSKIDPSEISTILKQTTAKGCDYYDNNKKYTINCALHSVKSISSKCVVAVKFEGYDGYYCYTNDNYSPTTLGDLINDLNLRKNLVFNKIDYDYWKDDNYANGNFIQMQYTLPDPSVIWKLLLSDTSLKNAGDKYYGASKMGVSIDVNVVGQKNISLAVNDAGYLQTNILNTGKTFYIGKDKVKAFIDYVLAHGKGVRLGNGSGSGQISPT